MMCHILDDRELYLTVTREITGVISTEQAFHETGIKIQLDECERLFSVYNECLRLYTSSFTVPNVVRTTHEATLVMMYHERSR